MRRAHPFFVAALALLGLGVAFSPQATGLPVPTDWDSIYKDLGDITKLPNIDDFPLSAAGHQPTSESLAHTPPLWLDRSAVHPTFTPPLGPSSAVNSNQHPTTQYYGEQLSSYDPNHLLSYLGPDGMLYHYPTLGDVSGSDRQQLLSPQRLLEAKPTLAAPLSSARQAKRTRASSEATDSKRPYKIMKQPIADRDGARRHTNYRMDEQGPEQQNSPSPLFSIASHQIGSADLKPRTLKEFKSRVLNAFPGKEDLIKDLEYQPAPEVNANENLVTNGFTIDRARARLSAPFSKALTAKRKQRTTWNKPPGTMQRLDQEMAHEYDANGYSIVFAKYLPKKKDDFVRFSIVGRKGPERTDDKVWVGDIGIPRSIWKSQKRRKAGSKRKPPFTPL